MGFIGSILTADARVVFKIPALRAVVPTDFSVVVSFTALPIDFPDNPSEFNRIAFVPNAFRWVCHCAFHLLFSVSGQTRHIQVSLFLIFPCPCQYRFPISQ